jgi:hypothetical protein
MWIKAIEGAAPSEDMPLNDGDIKRIDARIAAATALLQDRIASEIARLKPHGWAKTLHLLREWSVLGVTATIIVALLALALTQWNAANGRVAAEASFRTHTEDRLTAIEASLLAIRAKAVASSPPDSANQVEAKKVLASAKEQSVKLPLLLIEQSGRSFIDAAKSDSRAWDVALDFVSYRSVLNAGEPVPIMSTPPPGSWNFKYHFVIPLGKDPPSLSYTTEAMVPADQSARLDEIGKDQNSNFPRGPLGLKLLGGAVSLDAHYYRQVVFDGVEVHYHGTAVILDNVLFVNCSFILENDEHTRQFAEQVLEHARISWRS